MWGVEGGGGGGQRVRGAHVTTPASYQQMHKHVLCRSSSKAGITLSHATLTQSTGFAATALYCTLVDVVPDHECMYEYVYFVPQDVHMMHAGAHVQY